MELLNNKVFWVGVVLGVVFVSFGVYLFPL